MFNNTSDNFYFNDPNKSDYINYISSKINYGDYLGKTQENFTNIFSPSINNINVLELSSLNNNVNFNPQYQVKVKKLSQTSNIEVITFNSGRKTLILDLDETLVHSSTKKGFPNKKNIILNLKIKNIKYKIFVIIRPFFEKFLYEMSHCYDLYIFTASISNYAKPLIEIIDKNKVIIQVLTRDNCLKVKGVPLKDLSIFNKDLKDIIIIDNNPVSYALHKNNGIPILTWIDNPNDNELLKLIPILKYMSKVKDVRPIINKILNKSKNEIDFLKVNALLKNVNNLKQLNKKAFITNKIKDLNNSNENLINNTNIIKNNSSNKENNSNNSIKSKPIHINKIKNFIKNNNNIINLKLNKLNILKKLKLNTIANASSKSQRNPIDENLSQKFNAKPKVYNITIENISNIQNKIHIYSSTDINENEKEPVDSIKKNNFPKKEIMKKNKLNNSSAFHKNKITINKNLMKKFQSNKYRLLKKPLNLNLDKIKKNEKKTLEKEKTNYCPLDNINSNIEKDLRKKLIKEKNLVNENYPNTFRGENENSNILINSYMTMTEPDKDNTFFNSISKINTVFNSNQKMDKIRQISELNEEFIPVKKNRIIVMKILKKPNKKKEIDSFVNNTYEDKL